MACTAVWVGSGGVGVGVEVAVGAWIERGRRDNWLHKPENEISFSHNQ